MEPHKIGGRIFTLRMIADYCNDCIDWSEAKPIVEMLKSLMLGNCTDEEELVIKGIKHEFKKRRYGMHIDHADVAVGVAEKEANVFHHKTDSHE